MWTQSPAARMPGTLVSHRSVDADRTAFAELDAGGQRQLDVRSDADHDEHEVGGLLEAAVADHPELTVLLDDPFDLRVGGDRDSVARELRGDVGAELGIDGGEHGRQLLDDA